MAESSESSLLVTDQTPKASGSNLEIDPKKLMSKNGVIGCEKADGFQEMTNFSIEINGYVADHNGAVIGYLARVQLGTLRYGDYGLRTTDGRHFRTGTRHMCSAVPTVASSRRCVVEGFHVVQRGVVRGTEDGMKK